VSERQCEARALVLHVHGGKRALHACRAVPCLRRVPAGDGGERRVHPGKQASVQQRRRPFLLLFLPRDRGRLFVTK
jgi:hypothetical protein